MITEHFNQVLNKQQQIQICNSIDYILGHILGFKIALCPLQKNKMLNSPLNKLLLI